MLKRWHRLGSECTTHHNISNAWHQVSLTKLIDQTVFTISMILNMHLWSLQIPVSSGSDDWERLSSGERSPRKGSRDVRPIFTKVVTLRQSCTCLRVIMIRLRESKSKFAGRRLGQDVTENIERISLPPGLVTIGILWYAFRSGAPTLPSKIGPIRNQPTLSSDCACKIRAREAKCPQIIQILYENVLKKV